MVNSSIYCGYTFRCARRRFSAFVEEGISEGKQCQKWTNCTPSLLLCCSTVPLNPLLMFAWKKYFGVTSTHHNNKRSPSPPALIVCGWSKSFKKTSHHRITPHVLMNYWTHKITNIFELLALQNVTRDGLSNTLHAVCSGLKTLLLLLQRY